MIAASTTITRFIYDNEDILLELDGSNNIAARYTHGPGIDEPLVLEQNNQSFFYHADGLGSIAEITDSNGAIAQRYTYSSFGKIESQLDPNFIQPYTFTAREFDPETGLYFFRARTYDPSSGRFMHNDPIGFGGGINFYSFVGNNPVIYVDPLGLFRDCTYYQQVCKTTSYWNIAGKGYYCLVAPPICRNFPDVPGLDENCTRRCLQALDAPRCELRRDANTPILGTAIGFFEQVPLIVIDHGVCFASCARASELVDAIASLF